MAQAVARAAAVANGAIATARRATTIVKRLKSVSPRRFQQLIGRIELAVDCMRDVASGTYRNIPWKTVAALAAALAYFVAPLDAVPDFIPVTGFLDDAVVLGLVFGAAESDLRRYCRWRGLDPDEYFGASADA